MFVWPGVNGGGALYDPAADTWTAASTVNAPAGGENFTLVWTGQLAIVWGGGTPLLASGGRYDPVSDTWSPTSTVDAPGARAYHSAVWTGKRMVVWGGRAYSGDTDTGGRYDPVTDTWSPMNFAGAPSVREQHTAVWTGSVMIVWGGQGGGNCLNSGGRYDPQSDSWTPVNAASAPQGRYAHTAVWTGSEMIVWGGQDCSFGVKNSGGRYKPSTNTWSSTSTSGAVPSPRAEHTAVWTGTEMIAWGGWNGGDPLDTGGAYCASSSCAVSTWYRDADGDGRGLGTDTVLSCTQPAGYTASGGDCNDGNAGVWAVPGGIGGFAATEDPPQSGQVRLSWTSLDPVAGPATGYDVARGSLSALHGGGLDAVCAADQLADTPYVEASGACSRPSGDGCWYLVRGQNVCGRGPYGLASLDAANVCP